ncbi:metallo-beta-lactamase domain-containing protein 1 isoform X2 [Bicyclus anynana]|uniref:Metallo-beta-lactamase domain-containing protein 1 n=1 Tax=Bicyclus anynana TaxID=110368 RepID=A0ABM3M6H0_BICAN|nr:metallo-beta-lactamase domain-containing protein 1 isoform X2 [Bicyclus anynana]
MCDIVVLHDGYSALKSTEEMSANCTCTLIKGRNNIIIDTMTPWDTDKIVSGLKQNNVTADDINYVVSTHGHSDHIGNNNIFLKAKHIVGFSISFKDSYYIHPFQEGDLFEKFEDIADPSLWLDAGSEDPTQQRRNRLKVAQLADWIVPGHGPKFEVTDEIRETLKTQYNNEITK